MRVNAAKAGLYVGLLGSLCVVLLASGSSALAGTGSALACPAIPGKMPSTPGAICGRLVLLAGPGGIDIVSLPPGMVPCPSVPGKEPSSPWASCSGGRAPGPVTPDIVSLPPGSTPCPSLPGKPSDPTSACGPGPIPPLPQPCPEIAAGPTGPPAVCAVGPPPGGPPILCVLSPPQGTALDPPGPGLESPPTGGPCPIRPPMQ